MSEEQILLEAISSKDFKISDAEKQKTKELEAEAAVENKEMFGQDPNPRAGLEEQRAEDPNSLPALLKAMSSEQRKKVIEDLKKNGLDNPFSKEKLVMSAFTVDKIIREHSSK